MCAFVCLFLNLTLCLSIPLFHPSPPAPPSPLNSPPSLPQIAAWISIQLSGYFLLLNHLFSFLCFSSSNHFIAFSLFSCFLSTSIYLLSLSFFPLNSGSWFVLWFWVSFFPPCFWVSWSREGVRGFRIWGSSRLFLFCSVFEFSEFEDPASESCLNFWFGVFFFCFFLFCFWPLSGHFSLWFEFDMHRIWFMCCEARDALQLIAECFFFLPMIDLAFIWNVDESTLLFSLLKYHRASFCFRLKHKGTSGIMFYLLC